MSIEIKSRFPIFTEYPDLVYLDSAATTQKPDTVIAAITDFYQRGNANIHRGVYPLAAKATARFEASRDKVQRFINAKKREEVLFTPGTTAGTNLVAQSFVLPRLQKGDNVIITAMEHHANLIPWQVVCQQAEAELRVIPMSTKGELDLKAYSSLLSPKTRMVALGHISNTLGTINPVEDMVLEAKQQGVPVLIDVAQSIAHYPIDVQALDADFIVFSGHKLFGPTGIGVLHGKEEWLHQMKPYQYGGDMIRDVSFSNTTFAGLPNKFEAGTPNIAGAIGLGAAIDFLNAIDRASALSDLKHLQAYAESSLLALPGLSLIGTAKERTAIFSFALDDIHPHDIATFLGEEKIATRAGHHCTQPIMDFFGLPATTRASFSIYNTTDDVDRLVQTLAEIQAFFS
ncbi:MAG: cysteine desulfurase [Saprospiraceae bacterium]|nr:cysteine desulfurase [Saprospiraceae bacterium]